MARERYVREDEIGDGIIIGGVDDVFEKCSGLHVAYTWTTRGLHVDYMWPTRGLHVAYMWTT